LGVACDGGSISQTFTAPTREFTAAEVARHNTEGDCWIVLGSAVTGGAKVYDVTRYLDEHPGGAEVILEYAGESGRHPCRIMPMID
jgi:cytochrome b involved in lipid metabolism